MRTVSTESPSSSSKRNLTVLSVDSKTLEICGSLKLKLFFIKFLLAFEKLILHGEVSFCL